MRLDDKNEKGLDSSNAVQEALVVLKWRVAMYRHKSVREVLAKLHGALTSQLAVAFPLADITKSTPAVTIKPVGVEGYSSINCAAVQLVFAWEAF